MAREFNYQPLSAFDLLLSLTESQLRHLDAFFEQSKALFEGREEGARTKSREKRRRISR